MAHIELNLSENNLTTIQDEIWKVTCLTSIDLKYNRLKFISSAIL